MLPLAQERRVRRLRQDRLGLVHAHESGSVAARAQRVAGQADDAVVLAAEPHPFADRQAEREVGDELAATLGRATSRDERPSLVLRGERLAPGTGRNVPSAGSEPVFA